MTAVAIVYMLFFLLGMYGIYQIKHGSTLTGLVKLIICLAGCSFLAGFIDDSPDKNEAEKKPQQRQEQTQETASGEDWNMNFDDPQAVAHNMELCKKLMAKMDSVAGNARGASPADVLQNPEKFMGKVLEIGATVQEAQDFPEGSGGEKFFDGPGHVIIARANDGTYISASRKGHMTDRANQLVTSSKVGEFTGIVGMLAGIQKIPDPNGGEISALFIVGNPSEKIESRPPQNNDSGNVLKSSAPTGEHWIKDTNNGVYLWNPKPADGETASWSGGYVQDGDYKYADGFGTTTWRRYGEVTQVDEGFFEHGQRNGQFKHQFFPSGNIDYSNWEHGIEK